MLEPPELLSWDLPSHPESPHKLEVTMPQTMAVRVRFVRSERAAAGAPLTGSISVDSVDGKNWSTEFPVNELSLCDVSLGWDPLTVRVSSTLDMTDMTDDDLYSYKEVEVTANEQEFTVETKVKGKGRGRTSTPPNGKGKGKGKNVVLDQDVPLGSASAPSPAGVTLPFMSPAPATTAPVTPPTARGELRSPPRSRSPRSRID